tara:strand:+ start:80 stop:493 length:414 start_codon:yes stop_codon:yes gene_type:complete
MKNKILLLLVLLIPSLGFGESILIQYQIDEEQELATFVFDGTSFEKRIIRFKTHKNSIFLSDNKEALKKLVKQEDVFPNVNDPLLVSNIFKDSETLNPMAGFLFIEYLALKNNYAVTWKEINLETLTWRYFLYKQDK